MTQFPLPGSVHRLLFIYIFRDFDRGTFDMGFEFTTLSPSTEDRVHCRTVTINPKGIKRDEFIVNSSSRRILNLQGRYICYWVNRSARVQKIYNRSYKKANSGNYVHLSRRATSQLDFDHDGLERKAVNLIHQPRRYYEEFVRLLRF